MSNYNTNEVAGNLNVRHDINASGKMTAHEGNILGDFKVNGAIRSPHVSCANMGLFANADVLKATFPKPNVGMYATVGTCFPAELYVCATKGRWSDTGTTVTFDPPTSQVESMMKDAAQAIILDEQFRAEYQEQVLAEKIAKEIKDREWDASHLKDMCRRLAVMLLSKESCCSCCENKCCDHDCLHCHHCCNECDPDWLWKELLLGIRMDTETDVLTIAGVEYKLTRLHPLAIKTPVIETPLDVTTDATKGGFDAEQYPLLEGKTGAVYYITISQEDAKSIRYKLCKDGETEPTDWTDYTGAIVVKDAGTYTIKAQAYEDDEVSIIAISDEFVVTPLVYKSVTSITSKSLTYDIDGKVDAAGGEVGVPTLAVKVKELQTYTDGNNVSGSEKDGVVTSVSYTATGTTSALQSDGSLVFPANTSGSERSITVTATFVVTGVANSATASATVYQQGEIAYAECGVASTVPTTLTSMTHVSTGTLTISGATGKVQWIAIPADKTITSWYDNPEAYEMKSEIVTGQAFTYNGKSYQIYYNQVLIAEEKNYTIKFS